MRYYKILLTGLQSLMCCTTSMYLLTIALTKVRTKISEIQTESYF